MYPDTAEGHYIHAMALQNEGDHKSASEECAVALSLQFDRREDYIHCHFVKAFSVYVLAIQQSENNMRRKIAKGASYNTAFVESRLDLVRSSLLQEALAHFSRAIQMDPNHTEAYYWRGQIFLAFRNRDAAINDYNTAISMNPEYVAAYMNRGNAYAEKGEYMRAISDFGMYIRLSPYAKKPRGYFKRARAYSCLGDSSRAIGDIQMCLSIEPSNQEALSLRRSLLSTLREESEYIPFPSGNHLEEAYDSLGIDYESEYGEGFESLEGFDDGPGEI